MERLELTHDFGFFSNCSVLLEEIQRMDEPFVIDTTASFSLYRSASTTDIYGKYFEPVAGMPIRKVHFDRWMCAFDYPSLPLAAFSPSVTRWFTFSDVIVERSFDLQTRHGIDPERTLAVFCRGTDKSTETALADPAGIARLVNRLGADHDTVIVQTDDQMIFERLTQEIVHDVVTFPELPRYSPDSDPHLASQFHDAALLEDFLSAVLLISRCRTVIVTTSNVSLWIALLRGNSDGLIHVSDLGALRKRLMFLEARSRSLHRLMRRARRSRRRYRSAIRRRLGAGGT